MSTPEHVEILGTPPPWGAARIEKFVASALQRASREGGPLPREFWLTLCPWGERNLVAGATAPAHDFLDPRFRLVHFTSCSRPYLVAILIGEDAPARQREAMRHLPWSEHYRVELELDHAVMEFVAQTEEPEAEVVDGQDPRTLKQLLSTGELDHF